MMAAIYMKFDGDDNEYFYGCYPENTTSEKQRVQDIAHKVSVERRCDIRIERKKGNV